MDAKKRTRIVREVVPRLKKLFPHAGMILEYSTPWELLVAVILSAQCTDKRVNQVTQVLFKKYPSFEDYLSAEFEVFAQDIFSTGFYRAKAKNILAAAQVLKDTYGGILPRTIEEMVSLPGVARKTANVVLGNAYGIVEGIAVDTHVRRIARSLGLTDHTNPDKIEKDLMEVVPKKEWFPFTYYLIEYGRTYCPARAHDHVRCPLTVVVENILHS